MSNIVFFTKNISEFESSDGKSIILFNILKYLSGFSVEVHYFGFRNYNAEVYFSKHFGVKCAFIDIRSKSIFGLEFISKNNNVKPLNLWQMKFRRFNTDSYGGNCVYCFLGFESGYLMEAMSKLNSNRLTYYPIDSAALYYKRASLNSKSFFMKFYNQVQFYILLKSERHLYSLASNILFVSDVDKDFSARNNVELPYKKFHSVSLGIENPNAIWNLKENRKVCNIVFSGNYDYRPNFEAAKFIVEVLSRSFVDDSISYVFHLVGYSSIDLHSFLGIKNSENIVISGFVDDLDEYLVNMDLFISPLYSGAGMKNKVLKAMSLGIPIIGTSISIDGIPEMKSGSNCLIVDVMDGAIWKDSIVKLFNDHSFMIKASKHTREITRKYYGWDSKINEFSKILGSHD